MEQIELNAYYMCECKLHRLLPPEKYVHQGRKGRANVQHRCSHEQNEKMQLINI